MRMEMDSELSDSSRRGALIRVGIDSSYGNWNAPVEPGTGDFVFVPIPESRDMRTGYERPYSIAHDAVRSFADKYGCDDLEMPDDLHGKNMHLDPDFEHLTYGETNQKASQLVDFEEGDFLAFYAGLEPVVGTEAPNSGSLVYGLIGLLVLGESPRVIIDSETGEVRGVPEERYDENAHTRRSYSPSDMRERKEERGGQTHPDVLFRGDPKRSGRLARCIDIGGYRDNAYRVRSELLDEWGGLEGTNDGYIQRSLGTPEFKQPEAFLSWLDKQDVQLVRNNFG